MRHHPTVTSKKIDAKSHNVFEKSPSRYGNTLENGEHRFKMISDVAYCSSLRHSFDGGDPVEDWLVDDEVEQVLHSKEEEL